MVVGDASEKPAAPRGSDPGELLDLVRSAEEEATIAARERISDHGSVEIPVSSRDIVAVEPDRPSGEVLEVGDEVLEPSVPLAVKPPAREEPSTPWPPFATVPLVIALAIAALALTAR
jgi:hypothetical protein